MTEVRDSFICGTHGVTRDSLECREKASGTCTTIFDKVMGALDELTAPYIPPPEEARHLEAALVHLIAAFRSRDFEPGEEAVWNCYGITIGGEDAGAWEIRLRQTARDSGSHSSEPRR